MAHTIEIRQMRADDLPAVLEIQAACYTELVPESMQSLRAKLCACPLTCFVALLHGRTVGYLIALRWQFSSPPELNADTCTLPSSPDCLYLHDLAVSPEARNAGAGDALVGSFLENLMKSDLQRASLVAVQNSARYWERFGFRVVPPSASLKDKLSTYGKSVEYMERPA